jgi:hypothetical protein
VKKSRGIAALVFSLLLGLGLSPLAADPVIERGIDVFTTPADGNTFYDFARNPIPAGFFCDKSKPFKGRIAFKGLPLVTETAGQLGSADTVVERLDDAVFNARGRATTRIQFRALSLVSIAPIKNACGEYHTYVSLRPKQRVTTMNLYRTQEGGGNFSAPLAVDIRMIFIPVKPIQEKEARKLELTGRINFPAISIPWSFTDGAKSSDFVVVDTDGDQIPDRLLPGPSNFFPGRLTKSQNKTYCCWEYTCHNTTDGCEHCFSYLPAGCQGECP